MTQTYKVQVSMNQAHIVESGFVWKQGDFGFNIEIEVLDFDTTGATPQIIFRKSTGAVEATQISVAGNKFTYAIRGTELDTPGPCVCDLKLNDSTTKRVSTASFKYFVIPDTMDGLEQEASSYSDTIEQIVTELNDKVDHSLDKVVADYDPNRWDGYRVGAFVKYNDKLYSARFALPVNPGAFDVNYWREYTIGTYIGVNEKKINASIAYAAPTTYVKPPVFRGQFNTAFNQYDFDLDWTSVKRATADLRPLLLRAGDVIGLKDYTVYSIAVGTNYDSDTGIPKWIGGGWKTEDITIPSGDPLPNIALFKRNDNANLTDDDLKTISDLLHYSLRMKAQALTDKGRETIEKIYEEKSLEVLSITKNLFHDGNISATGEILPDATYNNNKYSDYISRTTFDKIVVDIKNGYNAIFGYALYDDDGNFVKRVAWIYPGLKSIDNKYNIRLLLACNLSKPETGEYDIETMMEWYEFNVIKDRMPKACKQTTYAHLSFDDVSTCFSELKNNTYESIFDNPFFSFLKGLHDLYGTTISLYVNDNDSFTGITGHKDEFIKNSDWLKIGFHCHGTDTLLSTDYATAKADYESFVTRAYAIAGGVGSIDRVPRLSRFSGAADGVRGLRDAKCGILGVLGADDSRSQYYLLNNQLAYLRGHSVLFDPINDIYVVSTVIRLDWFISGFSSQYEYNTPVYDNPYDEMVYRYSNPETADLYNNIEIFTHEWQIYSGGNFNANKDLVIQACKFVYDYNYKFDFAQNHIVNRTADDTILLQENEYTWELGAINSTGAYVTSTSRIRSEVIKANGVIATPKPGYKVNINKYNSENVGSESFVGRTDWQTTTQIMQGDYYYVVVFAKTDDSDVTVAIKDNVTIKEVK